MSRHWQEGAVLALVAAKGTHSSPALSLWELRLQGELGGKVSQLRVVLLEIKMLGQAEGEEQLQP